MKPDAIDRKARVWAVTLGSDAKLRAEFDPTRPAELKRAA